METTGKLALAKLGQRVTRMLRSEGCNSNSSPHCENTCMTLPTPSICDHYHEDHNAMLKAERMKSEALAAWQKHHFL